MEYNRAYFADKTAAVTGGASGIGLALCEELLESGARKVVLVDFNEVNLRKHEERLQTQYPGKVKGILCNVTKEAEIKAMIDGALSFGEGRLDLLINCAGAPLTGKFTEIPDEIAFTQKVNTNEEWEAGFALNFYSAVHACREVLPAMIAQGGGQIVNIISGIAFSPMAYQSMYAATKAALCNFTLCLRYEYGELNVKFNAATPGTTATAIFDQVGGAPPEAQTPHQSAQRILNGVANNDRLILGDDADVEGSKACFAPDSMSKIVDQIYLKFARQRRAGMLSFSADAEQLEIPQDPKLGMLSAIIQADREHMADAYKGLEEYLKLRDANTVDAAYYAGKTACITGGASGVGLALCEELLSYGAKKVVIADFNQENLKAQEERLNSQYPSHVKGVFCNVAQETSVQEMIAAAEQFFDGRFDLLINCAGIGQMGMFVESPLSEEVTRNAGIHVEVEQRWKDVSSVNFYGPLYGCRAVLPIMMKQRDGQIVNIISGTGFSGMPYQSIYGPFKAALNLLSLSLRYEYWDYGIKIGSATPGTTATAIFEGGDIPKNAQTPKQAAIRILSGAAKNDRLVYGDDMDVIGGIFCYHPEAALMVDAMYRHFEHSTRTGGGYVDTDFGL